MLTFAAQWAEMPLEIRKVLDDAGFGDPSTLTHAADWGDETDMRSMASQIGVEEEHMNAFL